MTTIKKAREQKKLVRKAINGDKAILKKIIEKNIDFCFSMSLILSANRILAKKVTKEVMRQVLKDLNNLSDPAIFREWLYEIIKQKTNKLSAKTADKENRQSNLPNQEINNSLVEDKNKKINLTKLLFDLPLEQREIFALVDFEGLNCNEVALLTNLSTKEVREKLYLTKKWLAQNIRLEKYEELISRFPHHEGVIYRVPENSNDVNVELFLENDLTKEEENSFSPAENDEMKEKEE